MTDEKISHPSYLCNNFSLIFVKSIWYYNSCKSFFIFPLFGVETQSGWCPASVSFLFCGEFFIFCRKRLSQADLHGRRYTSPSRSCRTTCRIYWRTCGTCPRSDIPCGCGTSGCPRSGTGRNPPRGIAQLRITNDNCHQYRSFSRSTTLSMQPWSASFTITG